LWLFYAKCLLQAKSDEILHLSKLAAKLETDLTRSKVNMEDEIKMQVK
jgi:hypothetical protein